LWQESFHNEKRLCHQFEIELGHFDQLSQSQRELELSTGKEDDYSSNSAELTAFLEMLFNG